MGTEGEGANLTGSRQFNLGMVHSLVDNLPFCYQTNLGSMADVIYWDAGDCCHPEDGHGYDQGVNQPYVLVIFLV